MLPIINKQFVNNIANIRNISLKSHKKRQACLYWPRLPDMKSKG